MKQKHVDMKIATYKKEAEMRLRTLKETVETFKYLTDEHRAEMLHRINNIPWEYSDYLRLDIDTRLYTALDLNIYHGFTTGSPEDKDEGENLSIDVKNEIDHFKRITHQDIKFLWGFYESKEGEARYSRYLDSKILHVEGDIIITDPCYIIKEEEVSSEDDDWRRCGYGDDMSVLGIKNYLTKSTLYGDWSCTTFNKDTKEPIGQFCADAGLVGVFLLDEVLAYNPKFNYHLERRWTTTWIKDFRGDVQIIVKCHKHKGQRIDQYRDDDHHDYECQVVGEGINMKTGEPIRFVGKQTGI